ncbi:Gfo/Idh/MocA family protein [Actinocatenispora rupis]|uniref:Oxidoreductase n=1 Tax=Actinocatenispora rupis TaxID=519421 RepID=A0A8J3N7R4_9ACTN|nr:Gfo/Idh/MocA family oxidoreductase [Actinocatenispora rupis]GID09559.1 oxidoreductase [Actinocatenispora rupis]
MSTSESTSDLRIGILGLGGRASLFDLAHRPGEGSRITAVCDLLPAKRDEAVRRFGPDTYVTADLADLLAQPIDAVGIFTEDHRHEEQAIACLRAGVPTFVEKPLAITIAGADAVLAAAADTGTPLYVGHNMRHMPVVTTMKKLIDDGEIGTVKAVWCRHFVGHGGDFYFADWHALRANTTGLLLQKGVHDIDVIHHLAGAPTRRTNAVGGLTVYDQVADRHDGTGFTDADRKRRRDTWPPLAQTELHPDLDVEDISQVNLVLANGVYASYQQCHYTPDYWRNYTVIGTEGRLENFGDEADAVVKVWRRRGNYLAEPDMLVRPPQTDGTHGGADPALVAEFLDLVRDGRRPGISPVAARDAVAAGCAATESLRSGGVPVDIAPVAPEVAAHFA